MTRSRTVTIVGSKEAALAGDYVARLPISLDKNNGFKEMNITAWGHVDTSRFSNNRCMTVLSHLEEEHRMRQFRRHFRV